MSGTAFIPVIGDLFALARELVVDKDKLNEINLKIVELNHSVSMALISSTTVPWVDATVKLLYALVALAAPLGSFAITCFGLWAYVQGVEIPQMEHAAITGAFPGWRTLRHIEKKAGASIPTPQPRRSGPPR